jgi:hypothetical protein
LCVMIREWVHYSSFAGSYENKPETQIAAFGPITENSGMTGSLPIFR